jgi:hypothetical protein
LRSTKEVHTVSEAEFRMRVLAVLAGFDAEAVLAMRTVRTGPVQPPPGEPYVVEVDRHMLGVRVKPDLDPSGGEQVLPECALPSGLGSDDPDAWDWAADAPFDPSVVMEEELYRWLAARWSAACDGRPRPALAFDEVPQPQPQVFDLVRGIWLPDPRGERTRFF